MIEAYFVYVLRNPAMKHYIGLTAHVAKRLEQHNAGISKWTGRHGPWKLVWQQGPMRLTEARKLENWLKHQKGGIGFRAFTGLPTSSGS
jgi:putative endonuclease